MNASNVISNQFFITLSALGEDYDRKHTAFGIVEEGLNILENINKSICDDTDRPLRDIRIKHAYILDDPFEDPEGLVEPESPLPITESDRLLDDEKIDEGKNEMEIRESIKEHEAKARAVILEMLGDLPDADIAPPDNVAFVCKLHPVTTDQDLYLLFSRFGPIKSCQVIRDYKTGSSLQYGFIEFENTRDCEEAILRMDGVLVDRRRIKVDFSQSVAKIWRKYRRGKKISEKEPGIKIKDTLHMAKFKEDRHKMVFELSEKTRKRSRSR
jgi:peptidyl-prolyl cis-trans isomerase-like 4